MKGLPKISLPRQEPSPVLCLVLKSKFFKHLHESYRNNFVLIQKRKIVYGKSLADICYEKSLKSTFITYSLKLTKAFNALILNER